MGSQLNTATKSRILGRIAEQMKDIIRAAIEKGYKDAELHHLDVMTFEHLSMHADDAAAYLVPSVLEVEGTYLVRVTRRTALEAYSHNAEGLFGSGFKITSNTGWTEKNGEWRCTVTAEGRGGEKRTGKLVVLFDASAASVQKVYLNDELLAQA